MSEKRVRVEDAVPDKWMSERRARREGATPIHTEDGEVWRFDHDPVGTRLRAKMSSSSAEQWLGDLGLSGDTERVETRAERRANQQGQAQWDSYRGGPVGGWEYEYPAVADDTETARAVGRWLLKALGVVVFDVVVVALVWGLVGDEAGLLALMGLCAGSLYVLFGGVR